MVYAEQVVKWMKNQQRPCQTYFIYGKAIDLAAEGQADICVSAVISLMAMSHMVLKPIKVLIVLLYWGLPTPDNGEVYLLDLGANVAATAQNLHQFAILAAAIFSRDDNLYHALLC